MGHRQIGLSATGMKRLVLVGAGHAHAIVLREWVRHRPGDLELIVVSPEPLAPYSGMVPGWLAGTYRFDEIVIDFPRLAAAAGAQWIEGAMDSLEPDSQQIRLAGGKVLHYDLLSLNLGSTLRPPQAHHARVLALRPLVLLRQHYEPLLARWSNFGLLDRVAQEAEARVQACGTGMPSSAEDWTPAREDRMQVSEARPVVVSAMGSGAAGFEALLAVLHRLRRLRPDRLVRSYLFSQSTELLAGTSPAVQAAARRALTLAGVELRLGQGWSEAVDASSDLVLWATGAQAHDWQLDPARRGALAVDHAGFIRIDAQLRSLSHATVFAAGDCVSWWRQALPKAGVYAVRMGPVLARNLREALCASRRRIPRATCQSVTHPILQPTLGSKSWDPLLEPVRRLSGNYTAYRPQSRYLSLLATGNGRAIASRGGLGVEGAWVWRWKNSIDRGFLHRLRLPGTSA
jgi:NADH dehydrogenase FAD-containing subunit